MKKMASFITLFLLLPCIVLGILLFWGFGLPAQYEETFLGEMKYKMDRLKETASLSEASSSSGCFQAGHSGRRKQHPIWFQNCPGHRSSAGSYLCGFWNVCGHGNCSDA